MEVMVGVIGAGWRGLMSYIITNICRNDLSETITVVLQTDKQIPHIKDDLHMESIDINTESFWVLKTRIPQSSFLPSETYEQSTKVTLKQT